jgi:hypothetical protein
MKYRAHSTLLLVVALIMIGYVSVSAQWDKKPFSEWSEKESLKLLNDSPWGQTQSLVDTSKMFDRDRRLSGGQSRIVDTPQVDFRIRFLSAKPVRQAISRYLEIRQKNEMSDQMASQLKSFAAADFPDYIIITVLVEAPSPTNELRQAASTLDKLTTGDLTNNTYLVTKGGQKIFLKEYQSPRKDGLGARFIFPRIVEGKPFLTPDSGEVQFFSELGGLLMMQGKPVQLTMRYKVKEMMFQGKLEY